MATFLALFASLTWAAAHQHQQHTDRNDDVLVPSPQNDAFDLKRTLTSCRRDPTWRSVDYEKCKQSTGWKPRDQWWKHDPEGHAEWLDGFEMKITNCLDGAFEKAKRTYAWAGRCDKEEEEPSRDDPCFIEPTELIGHYFHAKQGEIAMFANTFTEQEAFAVTNLERCVREIFAHKMPFYEVRAFGEDKDESTYGMYNIDGGNYCTFLNGLLQIYLPGVAATISRIVQTAYNELQWGEQFGAPSPDLLGVRTAEFLRYRTTGKLGRHEDEGSVYSVSIALSDPSNYDGGYFQLLTQEALFKLPRLSAFVFFSETTHAITDVLQGERTVFVVEMWEDDDTPVGIPRPDEEDFYDYKESRNEAMAALLDTKQDNERENISLSV